MVAWGCVPVGLLFHLHLHLRLHLRPSTLSPSNATMEFLQLLCDTLPGDLAGVCLPPFGLRYGFFRGSAMGRLGLPSTASQGFLPWRHLHLGAGLGASIYIFSSTIRLLALIQWFSPSSRPALSMQTRVSTTPPTGGSQCSTRSSLASHQGLPEGHYIFAS